MTGEITVILHNTNETLTDVHSKLEKINPVFDIIHDTGESAHHLTSTLVRFTGKKTDTAKEGADVLDRSQLEGLLRGAAFFYYLKQMSKKDEPEL